LADYAFFQMGAALLGLILIPVIGLLFVLAAGTVAGATGLLLLNPARRKKRAVCLLSIMGTLALLSGGGYVWWQSPSQVIRRTQAVPVLPGVNVLRSQENKGIDSSEVWLHLQMTPQALKKLVHQEKYEQFPNDSLNYAAYGPPNWWRLRDLGSRRLYYECVAQLPGKSDGYRTGAKDLVVNPETGEAFLLMRLWSSDPGD
jgi:hypothetical protein